jgi:sulfate adenylyltransferase subunit 1 (EFTu-like GTPase family)
LDSQNFIDHTNTIAQITDDLDVKMNDIARITGAVIFIDEGTNETVGVGMIE